MIIQKYPMSAFYAFFCSILLSTVLGNIGFEYELDVHVRKAPITVFGRLERQKPIATGIRGLWELQFDEFEEDGIAYVDCEFVFPPTRMFKGIPLNQAMSTICPAQEDLEGFLSQIRRVSLVGVDGVDVPYSDTIHNREHKIMTFLFSEKKHPLHGILQVTVGVHMDSCMNFFAALIGDAHIFTSKKYLLSLHREVTDLDLSDRAKALIMIISMYYINGNTINEPISDVKFIATFSSRTNLALLYSRLPEEDLRKFQVQNLFSTVLKVVDKSKRIERSEFIMKHGFGDRAKGTWKQGPTLFHFCQSLEQGLDIISTLDDSMGYLDPTGSDEIVLELRGMNDFMKDDFSCYGSTCFDNIAMKLLRRIRDLYQYFSLWEEGNPLPFQDWMGEDICDGYEKQEISSFLFDQMISTNLRVNPLNWNDFFQSPQEGVPLAAGPYGIWELTLHDGFLAFVIGSRRLFQDGLECTENQLQESLDALCAFIADISQTTNLRLVQEGNLDFEINVIGALPKKSVPLSVQISPSLSLETKIKGEGLFLLEHLFAVIGAIVKGFARSKSSFLDGFYRKVEVSALSKLSKAVLLLLVVLSGDWLEVNVEIDLVVLLKALNYEERTMLQQYLIERRESDEFPDVDYVDAIDEQIIEQFRRILKRSIFIPTSLRNLVFKNPTSIRVTWEQKREVSPKSLFYFYAHLLFNSDSQKIPESIQIESSTTYDDSNLAFKEGVIQIPLKGPII